MQLLTVYKICHLVHQFRGLKRKCKKALNLNENKSMVLLQLSNDLMTRLQTTFVLNYLLDVNNSSSTNNISL